ncbi:MAG: hypothetical protein R6U10_06265 [Thermoplasmatota archaeon]
MPNITLSVPDDLKEKMEQHPEIRWSQVARAAIEEKIRDLELLDRLTAKSTLTEEDVEQISSQINKDVARKVLHG